MTFEILRPVPLLPLSVSARVARPGRNVQLVEASLGDERGEVMRAAAWLLRSERLALDGALPSAEPPPGPLEGEERPFFPSGNEVGYHTAMEWRFVSGSFLELGPATVWLRMRQPLVAGEEPSPLQRVLVAADSGNGVSAALDYHRWTFVNTDLSVHLARMPAGEWVCLEAVTYPEATGVGLADTALHDERGRIGRAAQTLVLRRRGAQP